MAQHVIDWARSDASRQIKALVEANDRGTLAVYRDHARARRALAIEARFERGLWDWHYASDLYVREFAKAVRELVKAVLPTVKPAAE